MIRVKTHRSGKLNDADPHLVKWILPVFLLACAGMIVGFAGYGEPRVTLVCGMVFVALTGMGMAWPAYSTRRTFSVAERMNAHPERYYLIDPANFPGKSLHDVLREHDEKSGVLHMVRHPVTMQTLDYIEFDDEQDRIMFRLAVP